MRTFTSKICNRRVVLYTDNTGGNSLAIALVNTVRASDMCSNSWTGAQHTTEKGSARACDHAELVHTIWALAYANRCHLWIERVPSESNLSDSPSRFDYKSLEVQRTGLESGQSRPHLLAPFLKALDATWVEPCLDFSIMDWPRRSMERKAG